MLETEGRGNVNIYALLWEQKLTNYRSDCLILLVYLRTRHTFMSSQAFSNNYLSASKPLKNMNTCIKIDKDGVMMSCFDQTIYRLRFIESHIPKEISCKLEKKKKHRLTD
jgi:hypothetical protein